MKSIKFCVIAGLDPAISVFRIGYFATSRDRP